MTVSDIDECAENIHSCDGYQECRNTLGSHRCDCRIGFERDPLTLACIGKIGFDTFK